MPFNLPNILTLLRVALALGVMRLLFVEGFTAKLWALILFLAATATDYIDGRIARQTQQITSFGKIMDPIADKVLTLGTMLVFVGLGLVRLWMFAVIAARELIVTVLRLRKATRGKVLSAGSSGKWKTSFQFIVIVGILIYLACRECAWWRPEWEAAAFSAITYSVLFIVVFTVWSGARVIFRRA